MNLVWHIHNFNHEDWIRDLLGDVVTAEIMDLELACYADNAVHVVSGILTPLADCDAYFRECRARCERLVLFHCSDEWLAGGYELYRHFDLVIRHFKSSLAEAPGILTVPVGYANATRHPAALRPAGERSLMWSFAGAIKASRRDMARAFAALRPHRLLGSGGAPQKISKAEYDDWMEDSVFAPCPMGNVVAETWRFYEALELGCIPIVETRLTLDYYAFLLGPHPVPTFPDWRTARRYCEKLVADPAALRAKQEEIAGWWEVTKTELKETVAGALAAPSHRADLEAFAARARNRRPLLHEVLRLAELTRHQSARSFLRRLARPLRPLRRIAGNAFGRRRR